MYSHPAIATLHHATAGGIAQAVASIVLPLIQPTDPIGGLPPEWVHLIPGGTFLGRDGRGPYNLDKDAVLSAWDRHGADLPVDYEHQSIDAARKQGDVPAAGWIKALDVRTDGLWAQVEWTDRASTLLTNREYRYLSPVFSFDPRDGRIVRLDGAGLTHYPNLPLRAAASTENHPMNETLLRIAAELGIEAPESVAPIVEKIDAMKQELDAARTAAHSALTPDPEKWVPCETHLATAAQLATLQAQLAADQANDAAQSAMSQGKLPPGMKDWAMDYAKKDPSGFASWAASAPAVLPQNSHRTRDGTAGKDASLTEEERYVAQQLGIADGDFAAHKQSLNKE